MTVNLSLVQSLRMEAAACQETGMAAFILLGRKFEMAASRICELEDSLRLAEPLLPPNAPWGVVNKVRKALASQSDRGSK